MIRHLRCFVRLSNLETRKSSLEPLTLQISRFSSSSDEDVGEGIKDPEATENYRSWVDDMLKVGEQLTEQRATQTSSQAELDPISRSAAADASDARLDQNAADLTEQSLERGPNTDATPGPTGATPGVAPTRYTVMEEAVSALPDAVLGYRQLGITDPADGALLNEGDGAINSSRTFWTNDFYEPDELVSRNRINHNYSQSQRKIFVKKAGNAETIKQADFRNLSFLSRFTSEAGMIPPRRVTKLKKSVHTHLCRQIKIARQMALLPPEGKLPELMKDNSSWHK